MICKLSSYSEVNPWHVGCISQNLFVAFLQRKKYNVLAKGKHEAKVKGFIDYLTTGSQIQII